MGKDTDPDIVGKIIVISDFCEIGRKHKEASFFRKEAFDDLEKTYIVSSWGGNLQNAGANLRKDKIRPVYDVVRDYVKRQKVVDVSNEGNVTLVDYNCGCPTKGSRG